MTSSGLKLRLLLALWLLGVLFGSSAWATVYYVDTAAHFNAKQGYLSATGGSTVSFATLRAGDKVLLKGGTWAGIVATMAGSMTDWEAQNTPAVIYACDASYNPTPGGVVVAGVSQVTLAGSGIVFTGVTFSPTSGMYPAGNSTDYDETSSSAYLIAASAGSRYMTVSHVKFDHCGRDCTSTNDHYGPWIYLLGYHHTIQYCDFQGRDFNPNDYLVASYNGYNRTSIRDATIVIYKDSSDVDWGWHHLQYNYFGERKVPASSDSRLYTPSTGETATNLSNGWEAIRIGNGSFVSVDFNTTVEYNAFYHTIQAVGGGASEDVGEPEMVSNKSRKNIYRYNTFLNSYGQLSLRNGDYCVAQGNYFLAGGAYDYNGSIVTTESRNTLMGGIRVIGFGHTVANNYFYKLSNDKFGSALCLVGGTLSGFSGGILNNTDGQDGYETATYAHIIGNTFIDCKSINLDYQTSTTGTNSPYGTRFLNNLIYYSGSVGAIGVVSKNFDGLTNYGGMAYGNYV
jgi:poly(beta-D-mannuronate) lyase